MYVRAVPPKPWSIMRCGRFSFGWLLVYISWTWSFS